MTACFLNYSMVLRGEYAVNKLLLILVALFCSFFIGAASASENKPGLTIQKVIIFMRHSVRSPTKSRVALDRWSSRRWPSWSATPGYLSGNGFFLARMMGLGISTYYRRYINHYTLGSKHFKLKVFADNMERTVATGTGVVEGFRPVQHVIIGHILHGKDPLFHAVKMHACPVNKSITEKRYLQSISHSLLNNYKYDIYMDEMKNILCPDDLNRKVVAVCALNSPNKVVIKNHVNINGALHVANAVGESFLMEYADGKPCSQVGWGKVCSLKVMSHMLYLRNLYARIVREDYYYARHGATPVMKLIVRLLGSTNRYQAPAQVPSSLTRANMLILIGHDVNISEISGMLHLRYQLIAQPDRTPPDMALAFELLQAANGQRYIGLRIFYFKLKEMRTAVLQKRYYKPVVTAGLMPGCHKGPKHDLCTLAQFQQLVRDNAVAGCKLMPDWVDGDNVH